jgi:hypothetical protein
VRIGHAVAVVSEGRDTRVTFAAVFIGRFLRDRYRTHAAKVEVDDDYDYDYTTTTTPPEPI